MVTSLYGAGGCRVSSDSEKHQLELVDILYMCVCGLKPVIA